MGTGYLWNGGRIGHGCHDLIDELHGDVAHYPRSLAFLMGQWLSGFTLFSNCDNAWTEETSYLRFIFALFTLSFATAAYKFPS